MNLTEEHLDSLAEALIPILDKVGTVGDNIHGDDPGPIEFKDQPEADPDYVPPKPEDLGFSLLDDDNDLDGRDIQTGYHAPDHLAEQPKFGFTGDGGFIFPEEERLTWVISGSPVMDTSTPEPLRDGSYRIVLSPNEKWAVQSVMMSGLDSSMEIVLILAPKI